MTKEPTKAIRALDTPPYFGQAKAPYYGRDGKPISAEKAVELMQHPERLQVALHTIGEAQLSTVHLPIDRNFMDEGPPVIFESMIFGGTSDVTQI